VLLNLFGNGFYAANRRAKDGAAAGFLAPRSNSPPAIWGRAVEIRVRDNGTGIPEDIRDKLFQPFFTTKPTGRGHRPRAVDHLRHRHQAARRHDRRGQRGR